MLTLGILENLRLICRFSVGPLIENVVLLSYLCLSEMQLPVRLGIKCTKDALVPLLLESYRIGI